MKDDVFEQFETYEERMERIFAAIRAALIKRDLGLELVPDVDRADLRRQA